MVYFQMPIQTHEVTCNVPEKDPDACAALCLEEGYRSRMRDIRTGKGLSIRDRLVRFFGLKLRGQSYINHEVYSVAEECRRDLAEIRSSWKDCVCCPAKEGLSYDEFYGKSAREIGLIE